MQSLESDLLQNQSINLEGNIEDLVEEVNNALDEDKTLQSSEHKTAQQVYTNEYDEDFNPLRDILG